MGRGKKLKYGCMVWSALPAIIGLVMIVGLAGGGASGSAEPIEPPATQQQAFKYKYIGSELGVPWDIVMLSDAILAVQVKHGGIEDYNPILTSLKFCIIREDITSYVKKTGSDGKATWVWEHTGTNFYESDQAILGYIKRTEGGLDYDSASELMADINENAEKKSNDSKKYTAVVIVNPDLRKVLKDYIGLEEENIDKVMELHESGYILQLYDDTGVDFDSEFIGELPPLVVGDATREDLARVAVTLINHPYSLGSKYWGKGIPDGPLDCSGFVDWVYIQCFGKGVSAGKIPTGVPVSGTAMQFYACTQIETSELRVGDLGFIQDPKLLNGSINHVGIYIGKINGKDAFIHCAGRSYGYAERPTGRVGISINERGVSNHINPVTGGTFSPAMKGCRFQFFRRPNFQFKMDTQEEGKEPKE